MRSVLDGQEIHALHFQRPLGGGGGLQEALAALSTPLGADFLVLPVPAASDRKAAMGLLSELEALLEAGSGRSWKVALRPDPAALPALATLLKEARCDAAGYCWEAGLAPHLDLISDRIFCALARPGDDLDPLHRLGYRWNVAVPCDDPEEFKAIQTRFQGAFPDPRCPEAAS